MNYLAHLYLSGPAAGIKVGNFIGDYVKGSRHNRYAPEIQKGILLHRQIDSFMDRHPVARESATVFKPQYRRYASVVIDIIYDHLLAANWDRYHEQSLPHFVSDAHIILLRYYFVLPGVVKQFLPFLIKSRRMEHYRLISGVERTLKIMAGHSSLPDHSHWAIEQLNANYEVLNQQFECFFEEIRAMCELYLAEEVIIQRQAI
jgi:acyl carrier protein phosphodiesterase